MAKASLTLPNGTTVAIEGSPDEVRGLLEYYGGTKTKTQQLKAVLKGRHTTSQEDSFSEDGKHPAIDIVGVINQTKTCPEAESIEKYILDQANEANRVLIPLYIIHEHFENAFGLTTTEISKITTELGAKISRQNVLRAIKESASRFVIGDKPRMQSIPSRYKINRRGLAHIKTVISGDANVSLDNKKRLTAKPTRKKSNHNTGRPKDKKGPQSYISDLQDDGFFAEKRSIGSVQKKLEEMGHIYAQSSLSAPLLRLVRGKSLKRVRDGDTWSYIDP